MVIKVTEKWVQCDRCDKKTSGYSKFDMADLREPTVAKIRESENFRRVRLGRNFIDLCPKCFEEFEKNKKEKRISISPCLEVDENGSIRVKGNVPDDVPVPGNAKMVAKRLLREFEIGKEKKEGGKI